jgi:alpha-L-rhamnosidase
MSKIKNVFLAIAFCTSVNCFGQKYNPTGLLCELLSHPDLSVITSRTPEFSWIVNSELPGDYQMAYQIMVAPSPFLLTSDNPELWDSGKVLSNQSINIPYGGKPLSPNQSYWWKVQT